MRHFLLLLLLVMFFAASAQTRSDMIYKLDKSSFSAVVDEIGEMEIIYYLPTDISKRTVLGLAANRFGKSFIIMVKLK